MKTNDQLIEMEQAHKDMPEQLPDFLKIMVALESVRDALKQARVDKRSQQKDDSLELTDDEQRRVIEDVLVNIVGDNPFTNQTENNGAREDAIAVKDMSKSLLGFIKHCQQRDPEAKTPPRFSIDEYKKFAQNEAGVEKQMYPAGKKDDGKKEDDKEIKKDDSMDKIAQKIENAGEEFKQSPKYYETIIAILNNTLEGAGEKPNKNMYDWACQQLIDSKALTVEIVESGNDQKIKFAVEFPGISKEFKSICFKKQKEIIAKTTDKRDLFELDKVTASDQGGPVPKTIDDATLNKYDGFAKEPESRFHDLKKKIFPDHDMSQPIQGRNPFRITEVQLRQL